MSMIITALPNLSNDLASSCRLGQLPEQVDLALEIERLQTERERLMRLATAGAHLPTLLHELRKPLANVAAVLEGVLLGGNVDEKLLLALLAEVRRMSRMLDTAGATTRELRSAGKHRLDLDLGECRELLGQVVERSGITFEYEIDPMPALDLDPAVVRSLLCNLVANAVDACPRDARIRVHASHEVWSVQRGALVLRVEDTGVGMEADTLQRCTEPFFSTKREGSGIGLALCEEVVRRAGGTLTIRSRPGAGTQVQILVPVGF